MLIAGVGISLRRVGRPAPAKLPQGRNTARVCGCSGVPGVFCIVTV
jgi:hypothetical protein